jgi:ribosome silencing factor RsfS/YbeB/iojap
LELARLTVDIIAGKMGADILLLDLAGVTIIADYFVIATGDSDRQLQAIADDLQAQLKAEHGVKPLSVEGTAGPLGAAGLRKCGGTPLLASPARLLSPEELWDKGRTIVRVA